MDTLNHSTIQQSYEIGHRPTEIDGLDIDASVGWGEYPIKSVFFRQQTRTVVEILDRIKSGRFILSPEFKREFVWSKYRQSKLIESCIMQVPIPPIYAADIYDGHISIIEGTQRLSTLEKFVKNRFSLDFRSNSSGEMEHPLSGKKFRDLPIRFQELIEDTLLVIYILAAEAPVLSKLDVFERVNSGVPLTRQQMRNAMFYGPATEWLSKAASEPAFKSATGGKFNSKTMRDREAVNRFVSFVLCGWKEYNGGMDYFLAEGLQKLNSLAESRKSKLLEHFVETMNLCFKIFGTYAFSKSILDETNSTKIINMALFEVISVTFYKNLKRLKNINDRVIRNKIKKLLSDSKIIESVTVSTNKTTSVHYRHRKFGVAIKEIIREYC